MTHKDVFPNPVFAWLRQVALLLLLLCASAGSLLGQTFANWPELQKGQAPDTVFHYDDLDSVNLLNGNLTLNIPLGQDYPVGSTLSYGLGLVYNSNIWEALEENRHECEQQTQGGANQWIKFYPKTLDRLSNAGPGWMVSLGRFQPDGWEYFTVNKPPFTYVGADGSRHGLHPELHLKSGEPTQANVFYATDGSFLRMFDQATCASTPGNGGTCRRLEFPDGSYQEFHKVGAEADDFRPTLIADAFGNQITVTYHDHSWVITDDHLRTQRVDFDPATPARSYSKVSSVTLSAFDGQTSVYSFEYGEPTTLERHLYAETTIGDLQCLDTRPAGSGGFLGADVQGVELLQRLLLPDGSYYEMDYFTDDDPQGASDTVLLNHMSGAIEHLRLPSGLHYRWIYSWSYGRLKIKTYKTPRPFERVTGVAVKQRYILDEAGLEQDVVTWQYAPSRASFNANFDPENASDLYRPCFRKTDVRFFTGDYLTDETLSATRHSRHYFSSAETGPPGISFKSRKSLPFTVCPPQGTGEYYTDPSTPWYNDGLFLSQEILDPANPDGDPVRSTWVDYETDTSQFADEPDADRRVIRRRTVFHDDPIDAVDDHWIETRYEDFDGLGHYRKTVASSSFDYTDGEKTTLVTYNHDADGGSPSGPFFTPATSSKWLLGLYDERCRRQGAPLSSCVGAEERTRFDFDRQNGFLLAQRRLRAGSETDSDILTLYTNDGNGFVEEENVYGGDRSPGEHPLGAAFSPGNAPLDHRAKYWYSHGVLSRAVTYDGSNAFFETLNHQIDRNTGLVSRSRDAAGLDTHLDFDDMGRLISIETRKNGQFVNVATQLFRYTVPTELDPDLTLPEINRFCAQSSCPPAALGLAFEIRHCAPGTGDYNACHGQQLAERRFFYDRQGRLIDERRLIPWTADGEDISREVFRQMAYDLADRQAWSTEWHVSGLGFDVWFTGHEDYDIFDRARTIRRPDGKATTLQYTGERLTSRTVGIWSGNGETPSTTVEQRDGFGRLIRVSEPSGTQGATVHSTYTYDQADRLRLACVADADTNPHNGCGGQERSFTYDAAGFMVQELHPEIEGPVTYTYDGRGNIKKKDLTGTAHDLEYVYDAAGRVTQALDGDGYVFQEYFFGYSNTDGRRVGKLYQARRHNWLPESAGSQNLVDHVVTETFDHSAPGDRLASYAVRSSRGASFKTDYTYDAMGNLSRLVYPTCDRLPCSAAEAGPTLNLGNIADNTVYMDLDLGPGGELDGDIAKLRYRPRGTFSRIEHGNGLTDEIQRLLNAWKPIEKILVRAQDGSILWNTGSHEFDGAGNIYRIGSGDHQQSFSYDPVGRLTSATVGIGAGQVLTEAQSYDRFGNITTITRSGETGTRQLFPDVDTNRLGSSLASYDAGGNMTSWVEGNQTYFYDYAPDNRATTLEGSGEARAFLYTVAGERFGVLNQVTDVAEYMPRDPGNGLLSRFEHSSSGWSRTKDYFRAGSQVIATRADGEIRHLHVDHLGSTRLISDDAGQIVGELTTYLPFGSYAHDGAIGAEEHRFTGHERDDVGQASANLDYMHARYYASSIGRFQSVDPVLGDAAQPQSWNRYTYASNSPTSYVDPDGRVVLGLLKKTVKLAVKGGDVAATFGGIIEDAITLANPHASPVDRALAAVSLASEVFSPVSVRDGKAAAKIVDGALDGAQTVGRRGRARFEVTESGVAIPTDSKELRSNLSQLNDVSTSPDKSRKFTGTDSQGPVRVRVEKAHPEDPNFSGTPDPLHTVDHLHIDRRKNGETGKWGSAEKVQYDWPFDI